MKKIGLLLPLLFLMISCSKPTPVDSIDILPIINESIDKLQHQDTSRIQFCNINEFTWNELAIIPGYGKMKDVRKLKLKNVGAVKEQVNELFMNDFRTLFLFIKNDSIVRYSLVENANLNAPVMLHYINREIAKRRFTKEEICNKLFFQKDSSTRHELKL